MREGVGDGVEVVDHLGQSVAIDDTTVLSLPRSLVRVKLTEVINMFITTQVGDIDLFVRLIVSPTVISLFTAITQSRQSGNTRHSK